MISVAFAALAAYALARLKFLGAGLLTTLLLITYLLPGHADVHSALPDADRPGHHQHLRRADRHLPDLPDAVRDLGADRLLPLDPGRARGSGDDRRREPALRLLAITLPLAAPALLSVTLFAFTNAWNEFLFAFVFITSELLRTLPIGLQSMVVGDILPWGELMAASLLTAIPVAVLYIYAQRFLVEGLTVGAVKG